MQEAKLIKIKGCGLHLVEELTYLFKVNNLNSVKYHIFG